MQGETKKTADPKARLRLLAESERPSFELLRKCDAVAKSGMVKEWPIDCWAAAKKRVRTIRWPGKGCKRKVLGIFRGGCSDDRLTRTGRTRPTGLMGSQKTKARVEKEVAPLLEGSGAKYWQRPTFARPIDALSSGLRRFTSVFGMGTGGTTALISPEGCSRRESPPDAPGEGGGWEISEWAGF